MKVVYIGILSFLTCVYTVGRTPVRKPVLKKKSVRTALLKPISLSNQGQKVTAHPQTVKPKPAVRKKTPDNRMYVRVLLDERPVAEGPLWVLSTAGLFLIADGQDSQDYEHLGTSSVTFSLRNGALTVNGRKASNKIRIRSTVDAIHHGTYTYKGTFILVKKGRKVQLINSIELEDYVASGVRWEMLPGWHSAALQAGAIAYRTYVIKTILAGRKKANTDSEYDIRCTPVHQTYKGTHNCPSIHDAVKKTQGMILTYRKEPIDALYDACCGGSIPARREGIDFDKAPYLARSYACTYCKKSKLYTWRSTHSLSELAQALAPHVGKKGGLQDIRISDKDKAGAVRELKVKMGNQWSTINAQKIPQIFKNTKSSTFTLSKRGGTVHLEGFGYGHQYGFCQWGAQGMAERNWDHKGILRFYYPGTSLTKYTHSEHKA